jgi:hypothetical protein
MFTKHKAVQQIVTVAFAAAWIAAPPFVEGTVKGWASVQHNSKSFAEQTHEQKLTALHEAAYFATAAATHASLKRTENGPNVAAAIASLLIWVVIVTRTAAATHASDGTHSIVIVPWTSSIAGIATAVIPQTFKIVNALTKTKTSST